MAFSRKRNQFCLHYTVELFVKILLHLVADGCRVCITCWKKLCYCPFEIAHLFKNALVKHWAGPVNFYSVFLKVLIYVMASQISGSAPFSRLSLSSGVPHLMSVSMSFSAWLMLCTVAILIEKWFEIVISFLSLSTQLFMIHCLDSTWLARPFLH